MAEATAKIHERRARMAFKPFDSAQKQNVIAAVIPMGGTAFEPRQCVSQKRGRSKPLLQVKTYELVVGARCEPLSQRLLIRAQNMNGKVCGRSENRLRRSVPRQAPAYQGWVERYRCEGIRRQSHFRTARIACRYHCHTCCKTTERIAKSTVIYVFFVVLGHGPSRFARFNGRICTVAP